MFLPGLEFEQTTGLILKPCPGAHRRKRRAPGTTTGNNNPTGVEVRRGSKEEAEKDTLPFWPYFVIKDLFALAVVPDAQGDILYDRTGIFIERTRRVDMFLGGVFDVFAVEILDGESPSLRIRPLDINLESMENIIKS